MNNLDQLRQELKDIMQYLSNGTHYKINVEETSQGTLYRVTLTIPDNETINLESTDLEDLGVKLDAVRDQVRQTDKNRE